MRRQERHSDPITRPDVDVRLACEPASLAWLAAGSAHRFVPKTHVPAARTSIHPVRRDLEFDALAREHRLDQLLEPRGDNERVERCELLEPRPHLDVLHHPGNDRFERRRDRRELERDLLVQRQIDADARLERRKQHRIAELVDHLDERVADGDGPVPIEDEPQLR